MIRTTTPLNLKRRIAVIRPAATHTARLGSINSGYATVAGPHMAYTTLSVMEPESSQNWMSLILARQDRARTETPGTLFYTPANRTPAPNIAPWNSWRQPNCPAPAPSAIAPAAAAEQESKFWMIVGALGAAASGLYILKNLAGGDGKR